MTLEEILEEYGQEVLDTYYELFPDKDITKFPDRFCGPVGEYSDFVLDCYYSTGSDELETLWQSPQTALPTDGRTYWGPYGLDRRGAGGNGGT